ncbi:MAG: hypothetical protein LUG46_03175 [Erysipelotrichaceae bacterium]|nr:hypothetical protein [Erysipelotrichaceae bacterium]
MEKDNINIILENIKNQNEHFILQGNDSFYTLLKKAIDKDPRILVNYQSSHVNRHDNLLDVTMIYREETIDINDVIIDDGSYTLMNYTSSQSPQKIYLAYPSSKQSKKALKRIKKSFYDFYTNYEGLYAYKVIGSSFGLVTKCRLNTLIFDYCMPITQLDEKLLEADIKAKQVAYELTRNLNLPAAVKAFLALSYLQQNTIYDHEAFDETLTNVHAVKNNPYPHISYGPLIENKGICSGLSHAFKRIMSYMDEECCVINGKIRQIFLIDHAWNLIKIDGQYYHIDVTYDVKDEVCVRSFMKDDKHIKGHQWNDKAFPQAQGNHYNYEFVKQWLDEHGEELIEAGVDRKYVFPIIIE